MLLALCACDSDAVSNAAAGQPPAVDCPTLKAMTARFNQLDPEEQERDLAMFEAMRNLPHPVGLETVGLSPTLPVARARPPSSGKIEYGTVILTSGGCQLTVIVKTGRVEANIRAE